MDVRSKGRLLTIVVLGSAIVGIGAWHLRGSSSAGPPSSTEDRSSPASASADSSSRTTAAGLAPRPSDPATSPLVWTRDGIEVTPVADAPPLETRISSEQDLEELMGLMEWSLPVGQRGESGLAMVRCAAEHELRLEERCAWDVQAVLQRRNADSGLVVHTRTVLTAGGHQPACRELAACSAEAWAQREPVPMPGSLGDELSFTQPGRGSLWHPAKGADPIEHYRREAATLTAELERMDAAAQAPNALAPASLGWNSMFLRHRIDEYECMVDVLQHDDEPCRG